MGATYQQAAIPIADPARYTAVREAIATSFSPAGITVFLQSLDRDGVRIRDFEHVVGQGLLGGSTAAAYGSLTNGDQGQIREFYLASLEQVSPELRSRFYKLYAYY